MQPAVVDDQGLRQIQRELSAMETRISRQRDALLLLTTQRVECDRLEQTLADILEVAARTLDVARVSIWRYDDAKSVITCLDLFDSRESTHAHGATLEQCAFPAYFEALATSSVVAAGDAVRDPRTAAFADDYLRPLGITSMMDVPVHLRGETIGVLCHEHTGPIRTWTEDEKAFAIALSNVVSLAFERWVRMRAESESQLQVAALNAAADATVITDRDGKIVWTNPAFTVLSGYTAAEAVGREPKELVRSGRHDQAFYDEMWTTLLHGRVWSGEITNRRKSGEVYQEEMTITPVAIDGRISHFVAIKRDLTERRKLEAQYLQAQKMEVIGRLSGGVAHDFNNLLTVINGTAEMALSELPKDHPLRADFENIQASGVRAAGLTRQLLTFSRKQIVKPTPLVIAEVITGFKSMLQRLIGEDIALSVTASGSTGTVLADQGQIEQVVLNLAVNARDAMPRGGSLIIDAADVELDDSFAKAHPGVTPGPFVRLSVRDTGEGMSQQVMARIFEPFFTTKEPGKGTGLGLATVYAIVAQSGGTVWAASQVGVGTTFTIYLPRITGRPAVETVASPADALRPARGRGTILLVEDDRAVRDMTATVLRAAGYVTLPAERGLDALQILARHPNSIDLIITDVVLPGIGGHELATHASVIAPNVPVLFTSGHTDDLVLAHGVRESRVHFLGKPYLPRALCNKVREVLDAEPRGRRDN